MGVVTPLMFGVGKESRANCERAAEEKCPKRGESKIEASGTFVPEVIVCTSVLAALEGLLACRSMQKDDGKEAVRECHCPLRSPKFDGVDL